jgi:hypothetical protein
VIQLQDQSGSNKTSLNTTERVRLQLSIPKTAAAAAGNDAAAIISLSTYTIIDYTFIMISQQLEFKTNARDLQSLELILRVRVQY